MDEMQQLESSAAAAAVGLGACHVVASPRGRPRLAAPGAAAAAPGAAAAAGGHAAAAVGLEERERVGGEGEVGEVDSPHSLQVAVQVNGALRSRAGAEQGHKRRTEGSDRRSGGAAAAACRPGRPWPRRRAASAKAAAALTHHDCFKQLRRHVAARLAAVLDCGSAGRAGAGGTASAVGGARIALGSGSTAAAAAAVCRCAARGWPPRGAGRQGGWPAGWLAGCLGWAHLCSSCRSPNGPPAPGAPSSARTSPAR